jgi:NarL family two-component system response regulator LiaR
MSRRAPVTTVVIDDHVLFRSGLRELLEQANVRVVGEASTAELGIEVIDRQQPDVAIVDLSLPHMSGIDAIPRITAAAPRTQVLVLTVSTDESDMTRAVVAGACGYLLKDASAGDIVSGVLAAASGESMVSPRMVTALLRHVRERMRTESPGTAEILTAREREVLRLVVEGKDNAAIAQALFISQYTVKNHVSNILEKLHVENRLQAAVCAVRDSLV